MEIVKSGISNDSAPLEQIIDPVGRRQINFFEEISSDELKLVWWLFIIYQKKKKFKSAKKIFFIFLSFL